MAELDAGEIETLAHSAEFPILQLVPEVGLFENLLACSCGVGDKLEVPRMHAHSFGTLPAKAGRMLVYERVDPDDAHRGPLLLGGLRELQGVVYPHRKHLVLAL